MLFELMVLINSHFDRPIHLKSEHKRCPLLSDEHSGLLNHNIENSIVPDRLVYEWNIHLSRQALVHLCQLSLNKQHFFFLSRLLEHIVREIGQRFYEARSREIGINEVLVFSEAWRVTNLLHRLHLLLIEHIKIIFENNVTSFDPKSFGNSSWTHHFESKGVRFVKHFKLAGGDVCMPSHIVGI